VWLTGWLQHSCCGWQLWQLDSICVAVTALQLKHILDGFTAATLCLDPVFLICKLQLLFYGRIDDNLGC
jgi:hypothetical protein